MSGVFMLYKVFKFINNETDSIVKKAVPYIEDCQEIKFEKNNYLLYYLHTAVYKVGKGFAF